MMHFSILISKIVLGFISVNVTSDGGKQTQRRCSLETFRMFIYRQEVTTGHTDEQG